MLANIIGTANAILDKFLGISKETFAREMVVPANDNDVYNDNKCTLCWGPYDEDHPGARVLPCNHVFGRDCLTQIIDAPNGDHCPVCQTSLFRPGLHVLAGRWIADGLVPILIYLTLALYKLQAKLEKVTDKMGPPFTGLAVPGHPFRRYLFYGLLFSTQSNNVYFYAWILTDNLTNIRVRNPEFEPVWAVYCYDILMYAFWRSGPHAPFFQRPLLCIPILVLFALGTYRFLIHTSITNRKDRYLFAGIMLASLVTQFIVEAIMFKLHHCFN